MFFLKLQIPIFKFQRIGFCDLSIGIFKNYDGSTKNKGWSNSTGDISSTKIFTIFPETSDSISLKSFIASITQRTSPLAIVLPTSAKTGLSGAGFL